LYLLRIVIVNNAAAVATGTYKLQLLSSIWFLKMHCVFPEDGTHVPKRVGEAHLMFVVIRNVHLVGIMNGVYVDIKKMHGLDIFIRKLLTELHYIYVCINK
jgi:hypothetical protein